jgi:L-lactate dehydrogenase
LISKQVGIHPTDLRAYVLGEHGDSQFPALSCAEAGGEHIEDRPDRRAMAQQAKEAGIEVFRKKGYTNYAVAAAAATVIQSILTDARFTLPLSVLIDGYCDVRDVCLSVPVVVGSMGVDRWLKPDLSEEETRKFQHSAAIVRQVIRETTR